MFSNSQDDLNAIAQRNYSVKTGQFVNQGWQIFSQNAGGFIGFCVLTFIISIVLSNIPGAGGVINGIISGILTAGYYIVAFKIRKQQPVEFGDFFKGFQNTYFMPVFLANLVIGLFVGLLSLAFMGSVFAALYVPLRNFIIAQGESVSELPDLPIPPGLTAPLLVVGIILLIPAIYLGVAYTFSIPLILDKQAPFWTAMETSRKLITKNWFAFFGFTFLLGLINMGGVLICGLGLLLTVPLTLCAVAAAYENIVGLSSGDGI